jgi:hypothetical protein
LNSSVVVDEDRVARSELLARHIVRGPEEVGTTRPAQDTFSVLVIFGRGVAPQTEG